MLNFFIKRVARFGERYNGHKLSRHKLGMPSYFPPSYIRINYSHITSSLGIDRWLILGLCWESWHYWLHYQNPVLCRVLSVGHSAKKFLPSAALDKVQLSVLTAFTESRILSIERHSAKTTLPSAKHSATPDSRQRVVSSRLYLTAIIFAECRALTLGKKALYVISVMIMWYLWCIYDIFCLFGWNRKNKLKRCVLVTLPSAVILALGKEAALPSAS
jgi:hypothetical protein